MKMRNLPDGTLIGPEFRRQPRRRRGSGYLWLLALLAIGVGGLLGPALFQPWIFHSGGHFHWTPAWAGMGRLTADNGDNYSLYVWFQPRPASQPYLSTYLRGNGYLCTPDGQRLYMKVTGGMPRHLPMDVTGQPITLHAYQRNSWWAFAGGVRKPGGPEITLKGTWGTGSINASGVLTTGLGTKSSARTRTPFTVNLHESSLLSTPPCPVNN